MSYDQPYKINHQELLTLSYNEIASYCDINNISEIVCEDDSFWIEKLNHDMHTGSGRRPSDYVIQYQHPDTRGLDIYKRWMEQNMNDPNNVNYIISNLLSLRFGSGQTPMTDISSDIRGYIKMKYDDMVFWIMDVRNLTESDYYSIFIFASTYGNIEILNLIEQNLGQIFQYDYLKGANEAARNNHPDVLEWYYQRDIIPDYKAIAWALKFKLFDTLDWLIQRRLLIISEVNFLIQRSSTSNIIPTLNWLEQHGVLPTTPGADYAAKAGNITILQWLEQRGILPSQHSMNQLASRGYLVNQTQTQTQTQ